VIDQNGFKTIYGYDDADRIISVTDPQSPTAGVTTYAYDTENNLTDIYDAAENHTHMDGWPGLSLFLRRPG
jgi:YD repeat-containing protein